MLDFQLVSYFANFANKPFVYITDFTSTLSFAFSVNGERQGVTLAAKFSFNLFVSNFLSHVKRIIKH